MNALLEATWFTDLRERPAVRPFTYAKTWGYIAVTAAGGALLAWAVGTKLRPLKGALLAIAAALLCIGFRDKISDAWLSACEGFDGEASDVEKDSSDLDTSALGAGPSRSAEEIAGDFWKRRCCLRGKLLPDTERSKRIDEAEKQMSAEAFEILLRIELFHVCGAREKLPPDVASRASTIDAFQPPALSQGAYRRLVVSDAKAVWAKHCDKKLAKERATYVDDTARDLLHPDVFAELVTIEIEHFNGDIGRRAALESESPELSNSGRERLAWEEAQRLSQPWNNEKLKQEIETGKHYPEVRRALIQVEVARVQEANPRTEDFKLERQRLDRVQKAMSVDGYKLFLGSEAEAHWMAKCQGLPLEEVVKAVDAARSLLQPEVFVELIEIEALNYRAQLESVDPASRGATLAADESNKRITPEAAVSVRRKLAADAKI